MARGTTLFNFGNYTFASWARRGVANTIPAGGSDLVRARVPLSITLNGEVLSQPVELLGPADITSILGNAIVRTEPLNGNFNFEWSMLPYIEFYDEDFAWRYSPDAPDAINKTLQPWIALVVLKEEEFTELPASQGSLPAIRLQAAALPLSAGMHLWAHMHTGSYAGVSSTDLDAILLEIGQNFAQDPDGVTCRLLSPRRLDESTLYHAFLVPAYESGRLAGLGEPYAQTPATQPAWTDADRPATIDFPYYYRWSFATTDVSFEDLVSKMKTASANPQVGIRDMDTSRAGYIKSDGLPGPGVGPTIPSIMGLEGALRAHSTTSTPYLANGAGADDDGFQKDVAALLDLYDKSTSPDSPGYAQANMNDDPVLTIPLYGQPYVSSKTTPQNPPIVRDGNNWYSAINFDPRNRVAAGIGSQVIQQRQETLMQSAWYQLQVLSEARNHFAGISSIMDTMRSRLMNTSLVPAVDFVAMAGNMTRLVTGTAAATTVFQNLTSSATPNAIISSAARRVMRSNGNIVNRFKAAPDSWSLNLVNEKLTGATLTNYRVKFQSVAVAANVNFSAVLTTDVPSTPLTRAFSDLNIRIPGPFAPPPLVVFPFVSAQLMISAAMSIAPMKLLTTRLDLPAAGTATPSTGFAATTVSFPASRPPAEFIGQPVFLTPMYEPLWKLDKEWFLPNINLIENNTITLLETNPHFINSYMLGLNQEMGREMLWRRFPADLSATFFRTFWQTDDEAVNPVSYDIDPIKTWIGQSAPERQSMGSESNLVLTLRGELLRKFPNTVILAANLQRDPNTDELLPPNEGDFIFPSFHADLPPDLKFIGFNLKVSDVFGNTSTQPPGMKEWYFILMEPVGEPRFGLDSVFRPGDPAKYSRNDLSWDNLKNPGLPDFLTASNKPDLFNGALDSNGDDELWGRNSAGMAALLFQQPFSTIIKATDFLTPSK